MERYIPRKLRPWMLTTLILRGVIRLLELWPLVLLLLAYLSPVQPHLRYQYRYYPMGHSKHMLDCDYVSLHGFIKYRRGASCPLVVYVDLGKHDLASNIYRQLLRKIV